jgi:hypothetical protein
MIPSLRTCTSQTPIQDLKTYRAQFLNALNVIQLQLPLLNELHTGNTRDHLRTAGDPKDILHRHVLIDARTNLARCMLEDQFAGLVHGRKDDAWCACWIGSQSVDLGFEFWHRFCFDFGHLGSLEEELVKFSNVGSSGRQGRDVVEIDRFESTE